MDGSLLAKLAKPAVRWGLLANAMLLSLAGCSTLDSLNPFSSTPDVKHKPAELHAIHALINARVSWKQVAGKSEKYQFAPAVVGDSVFVAGAAGDLQRLEAGRVVWKTAVGQALSAGVAADARIVVVGTPKGEVLAFDAAEGKPLWKSRVSSELLAPPALAEGLVVVRSGDNRLFALDAADGQRRWVYQRPMPALSLRSFAAPLIDGSFVFAGFPGGKLVAVTINGGAQAWEGTVAVPKGVTELDRVADINTAPVIAGRQVCAVAYQGKVACFDLGNGGQTWARELSSTVGLSADERQLYVTDDKSTLHALDLTSGASLWKQDRLQFRQLTAPQALGRSVAVADLQGFVHFINAEDGGFLARVPTEAAAIVATPQRTPTGVVVQSLAGGIFAIETQ